MSILRAYLFLAIEITRDYISNSMVRTFCFMDPVVKINKSVTSRRNGGVARMRIYKLLQRCIIFDTKPRLNHRCKGIAKTYHVFGHHFLIVFNVWYSIDTFYPWEVYQT